MISLEERVAYIDGTVAGHTKMIDGLREAVASLEQRMDRRFERMDQRFDALDAKMSRQFYWLVGILIASLLAMLGMLGSVVSAVAGK